MLDLFYGVLDLSKTGGLVILGVVVLRLLLKKAPKIFSYALWSLVLVRLLCPISIEAPVSLLPETQSTAHTIQEISQGNVIGEAWPSPVPPAPVGTEDQGADEEGLKSVTTDDVAYELTLDAWLCIIWLSGIAAVALYSLVSYWKLKRRLIAAVPMGNRVYIADHIPSPFVLGLIFPKIYLPSGLNDRERTYILLHEHHHIRRGDHIWKALGFLALTVHWFNPLVWLAFFLAGKDMEMSCDEAVVKRLGEGIRADYSASLLSLATGRRIFAGTPLAFGEGDPKGRIRNLLNWKKPKFWVLMLSAVLCITLAVTLLTDPVPDRDSIRMEYTDLSESVQFALDQENLQGGTVLIQHWTDGVMTQAPPIFFDGQTEKLRLTMIQQYQGAYAVGAQIQVDTASGEDGAAGVYNSALTDFDFSESETISGWGFSTFRENEKIQAEPGSTHILAGWFFDVGTSVQGKVLERSLMEQEPERLRELENAIVVSVTFSTSEEADYLLMDAMMSDNYGISLAYVPRLGSQVGACRIYPELWVEGTAAAYPYLQISPQDSAFEISLDRGTAESLNYRITAGTDEIRGVLPLPEDFDGAVYTYPDPGESIDGLPGDSRIIGVVQFSRSGRETKALDCEVWEQEPWRLEEEDYILLLRAEFLPIMEASEPEEKPVLTLETLTALSKKGEALSWEDFENYASTDVGFGAIVLRYETDDPSFCFTISGPSLEEKPLTMFLTHTQDPMMDDDIRYMDVADYIRRYREALPKGLILEDYPMGKIFLPLESYDRSPWICYYVPADQAAWIEEFQKVYAASKEGGWPAEAYYAGLQVVYEESYYMLTDQGGFILKDGDVRVADPEASATLRELVTQAADEFYGGRRFSQEALAEETLVKATLSGGEKVLTDPDDLAVLQKILTEAAPQRGVTACDFSRRLTLETENGVCINVYLSVDGCGLYTADGLYFQYSRSIGEDGLLALFTE